MVYNGSHSTRAVSFVEANFVCVEEERELNVTEMVIEMVTETIQGNKVLEYN